MEPFLKVLLDSSSNIEVVTVAMDLFCHCNIPDIPGLGQWIAYDKCDQWYLQKYEGVTGKKISKTNINICKNCHKTKH